MVLHKYACRLPCLSQKDIMLVTASPSEKRFIYHAVTDLSHSELSYKYFVLFTAWIHWDTSTVCETSGMQKSII